MPHDLFEDLTLERFLRLPEAKPALEFIDGNVVQKVSGERSHSLLKVTLGSALLSHARARRLGSTYLELQCTFGGMSLVPDISYIRKGRIPRGPTGKLKEDIELAPDLMVEILSPGEQGRALVGRLRRCVRVGVRLGWLIQPRRKRVFVVSPGKPTTILEPDSVLDGGDVLPDFALPIAELFGWLDED